MNVPLPHTLTAILKCQKNISGKLWPVGQMILHLAK